MSTDQPVMAGGEHFHHGSEVCHHKGSNGSDEVLDPTEDFIQCEEIDDDNFVQEVASSNRHCVKTINCPIATDQRVLPLLYNGASITREKSLEYLLTKKKGKRLQCNGLVYDCNQMPNEFASGSGPESELVDNNGWPTVIRRPSMGDPYGKDSFMINTNAGYILVHYYDETKYIMDQDRRDFERFVQTHSRVRDVPYESGVMVSAGHRFDFASSSATTYRGIHMTKTLADSLMKHHSMKLYEVMIDTVCKKPLLREIRRHQKFSTGVKVGEKTLMPSLAIAEDLTSSIHVDVQDDTRGFSVYFSKNPEKPGLTWFLLPEQGLAIQLKAGTVLSWESSVMPHCSCSVRPGVNGSAPRSNRQINQKFIAEKAFSTAGHGKDIKIGQKVLVRSTFGELEQLGVTWNSTEDCSIKARQKKKSYRQATVKAIDMKNRQVTVLYDGKLKWLKEHKVSMFHVCHLHYLDPTVLENKWNAKRTKQQKSRSHHSKRKRPKK